MPDQTLTMLRYLVGATRPLRLAVRGPEGGRPEFVEVDSPYAVIGRGEGCHVQLAGDGVAFRHAFLQVLGGRVACIDLHSAAGIAWDGPPSTSWLSPQHRVRVGPHWIQLFDDGWLFGPDVPCPLEFKPRVEQRPEFGLLPEVELELANTSRKGMKWPINRVITLLGRDDRCRITCVDERISKVHCALVLVPSGVWVIDLLGRDGIQVNGERCAHGSLYEGAELRVGNYILRAHYPHLQEELRAAAAIHSAPSTMQVFDGRPTPAFLTSQHRVFLVLEYGETLIVAPQGDIRDFAYQEIQVESNRIVQLLQTYHFQHVIVDFSAVALAGSVILDCVAAFCRTARGRATLCGAGPDMYEALRTTNFTTIWPYFATRDEALLSIYAPEGAVAR
jgi:anti-anti-sigma regulatory factor